MRLKICGLTRLDQAQAVARLGVAALGFICVPSSPRYLAPEMLQQLTAALGPWVFKVGVFANEPLGDLIEVVQACGLNGVQVHGDESPSYCRDLGAALPNCEIIRALRLRSLDQLQELEAYWPHISAVLLDAYQPHQLGGTGQKLDWTSLVGFDPPKPWILAGGLTPENVREALGLLQPDGLDVSSGVEVAPGDKDLGRVEQFLKLVALTHR